jgi:hypothetical protein
MKHIHLNNLGGSNFTFLTVNRPISAIETTACELKVRLNVN